MTVVLFALGLALLAGGAEVLVRGASRLAALLGVSPLLIGLTIVSFATSAPELAVGIRAAATGGASVDLAVGNIIGSNIFNVLFVLGVSALVAPLFVTRQLVRVDVPIMIALSLLVFFLAWDGHVSSYDGLLLFVIAIAYLGFAVVQGRREALAARDEYIEQYGRPSGGVARNALLILAGLALLVVGAEWLVRGAVAIARHLGVSEMVIGLTLVAGGTSLPEVATSVMASVRGQRDIAVGNAVGSCIFNLVVVLGVVSIVAPGGLPVGRAALTFDMPVMIAVAAACLPIFFTRYAISRWEGALFLGYYAAYTAFLILNAARHDALETFGWIMVVFVGPLTVLTLAVTAWGQFQRQRR